MIPTEVVTRILVALFSALLRVFGLESGAGPSFPNKISNPAAAPSLSLRSLQGQGGELDLASSTHGDQNPPPCRKRRDKSGAPSRIRMRKGWASPQGLHPQFC